MKKQHDQPQNLVHQPKEYNHQLHILLANLILIDRMNRYYGELMPTFQLVNELKVFHTKGYQSQ